MDAAQSVVCLQGAKKAGWSDTVDQNHYVMALCPNIDVNYLSPPVTLPWQHIQMPGQAFFTISQVPRNA